MGRKLKAWCNQGVSLESIRLEVKTATTLEGLRHLYQKYNSISEQVKPLILERKAEIENNSQIIDNAQIIRSKTI